MTPETGVSGLWGRSPRAILLDIEGTTTPISFVYDVLFPFARAHVREYIELHRQTPELIEAARLLGAEHAVDEASDLHPPPLRFTTPSDVRDSTAAYVNWLMDQDRKSPGLKRLQGLIWERGYQAGVLRGQVFPDVAPAIRRWRSQGLDVAIYSSGSELAQRRLFESTSDGDLTPLISGFFDTAVGAKMSPDSYRRIAEALGRKPAEILFASDVTTELQAARDAGLAVVLAVRPGNAPQENAERFDHITSLDQIR